ncbi:ABC transporter substrate-binding protein [Thermoanaerobacterium thermosaccharolyticum]|uniref:ABC transporter substrate-binding protein n=1 Tax=Thermoanaerobacterium thermosaccharolyticum TaxID=1517 RepID=UPI003DA8D61B
MKKFKKTIALVISLIMLVTIMLTGCSNSQNSKNGVSKSETQKEITLRFSWWGGDTRHQATLNAIKLFEQKYPNIKIKAEYGGFNGYLDKLTAQIAGGTAPDIMQLDWNWLWIFSKDGSGFYDLNNLSKELELDTNYSKNDLGLCTINGKLNAIPVSLNSMLLYYNKTTFDNLGVSIPKTWDDLLNAGNTFYSKGGYYPLALPPYVAWLLSMSYAMQVTGKNFMDSNGKLTFTEDDIKIALEFYKKLLDNHVTPPIQKIENEGGTGIMPTIEQLPSFLDGKFAGEYQWISALDPMVTPLKQKNMEVAFGGIPIIDNAKVSGLFGKPSMVIAINKNTKYPKEAATFLNFILNDPEGVKAMGLQRGIPLSNSAYKTLDGEGQITGLASEGLQFTLSHSYLPLSPYFENDKLRDLYGEVIQNISTGTKNVDEASKYMYENVQNILSEIAK